MTFNIDKFLKQGESFFAALILEMKSQNIDVKPESADHLCFRVNSADEYTFYKSEILNYAKLLTEAMVNSRPICTFKMKQGFKFENHTIELLELPFPKPGSDYVTGFEHAEFVLNESFQNFQNRHTGIEFKVAGNKNLNPELCVKTKSGQAKFHYSSLERVVELEETKITDVVMSFELTAINSSTVKVHKLEGFNPSMVKPGSTVLLGASASDMKTAKEMKLIAAAALWKKKVDVNSLIQQGAELFFFDAAEFTQYLQK